MNQHNSFIKKLVRLFPVFIVLSVQTLLANAETQLVVESAPAPAPAASTSVTTTTVTTAQHPTDNNTKFEAEMAQFQQWLQQNGQTAPPPKIVTKPPVPKAPPPVAVKKMRNLEDPNSPVIEAPMTFTESRQVMLNSLPQAAPPSEESQEAFNLMMKQNVPLTPQQVIQLRQMIDTSQRAAAVPANVPPKPVSSTLLVNLAPGATPPAIRLAQGYITSLVFVDSTGAPWPIASYDLGDPKKLGAPQWDGKSNILLLQAISPYGDSDLVIRLVGLPTPITLQLVFGQRVVDYRTDIHVSGIGPNAKELPIGTGLPNSANQLLLSVLDGISPPDSRKLNVVGCSDCLAWLLGDKMFFRTRFTLLSPGWIGRMVSPDGMHAYEVQRSSSVLISQYGSPVELKIEGF